GAVTFTNPWEVVKTRLQLQGELESRHSLATGALRGGSGSSAAPPPPTRVYTSAGQAFVKIFRQEGLRGIQKGLAPAYVYQILLNGTRLGLYEPIRDVYQRTGDAWGGRGAGTAGTGRVVAMVLAGATSGVLGASLASPLYLIKTRMQSYSAAPAASAAAAAGGGGSGAAAAASSAAVGHQHSYVTRGTVGALAHVYRHEGVRGLWRGVDAAMMRTGVGSAVQLSSYDMCKQALLKSGWFDRANEVVVHFGASAVTSLLVCIAMNPFDVASTRMYNQHVAADGKHGSLYKSGLDCIVKTVRAEGVGALYKGFFAHYLRIG
ncbi:mitochondrial carrier domain-containing protein, partial [Zopfochytrium polystomum]